MRSIAYAAVLSTLVILPACTWNSGDLTATVRYHKEHRTTLELAMADARKGFSDDVMRKRYPSLCTNGWNFSKSPLIAEFAPISSYYVLVFGRMRQHYERVL